jgi:hypothetical protein
MIGLESMATVLESHELNAESRCERQYIQVLSGLCTSLKSHTPMSCTV